MNCNDVLPKLHELVDGELDSRTAKRVRDHLTACRSCKQAQVGISSLKCLLREKVERPKASALLSTVISQQIRRQPGPLSARGLRLTAAAALLVVGIAAVLALFLSGEPRLGHAEVAAACVEAFYDIFRTPEESTAEVTAWNENLRKEIYQVAGITLDQVPSVPNARYVRWERQTLKNVKGVRLDFKPVPRDTEAKHSRLDESLISVFLLPLKNMRFEEQFLRELEEGHACTRCIQLKTGAIYCFRSRNFFISAVTNLGEEVLLTDHLPR